MQLARSHHRGFALCGVIPAPRGVVLFLALTHSNTLRSRAYCLDSLPHHGGGLFDFDVVLLLRW